MKIAIVGGGIVGAFAHRAVIDTFKRYNVEHEPVKVYSLEGERRDPPAGAFYLHQLPGDLQHSGYSMMKSHSEQVIGSDRSYYGKLQGLPAGTPTSVDTMPFKRVIGIHPVDADLLDQLWLNAQFMPAWEATRYRIGLLALECDVVISTINVGMAHINDSAPVVAHHVAVFTQKDHFRSLYHLGMENQMMSDILQGTSSDTLHNCTGRGEWIRVTFSVNDSPCQVELTPLGIHKFCLTDDNAAHNQ